MTHSPSGSRRHKPKSRQALSDHPLLLGLDNDARDDSFKGPSSINEEPKSDQEPDIMSPDETLSHSASGADVNIDSRRSIRTNSHSLITRIPSSSTMSSLTSTTAFSSITAPTASTKVSMQLIKDAAKELALASDSVGLAILTRISESPQSFSDILDLLTEKNAMLLLPRQGLTSKTIIDKDMIENHVIIEPDNVNIYGSLPILSCSGIRGILEDNVLTFVGILSSKRPIIPEIVDAASRNKLSPLPSSLDSYPAISLVRENVALSYQDKLINTSVIMDVINKRDIEEKLEVIRLHSINDQLQELPDNARSKIRNFISNFEKTSTSTKIDVIAEKVQRLYEDVSASLHEVYKTNEDLDTAMEKVEYCVSTELFDLIFSPPTSDDGGHDQALSTRVAALNILDLVVDHLGVSVQESEREHIDEVVKAGGRELQKLQAFKSPREKLAILVAAHKVVVDSLSKQPVNAKTTADGTKDEAPQRISSADLILPLLIFSVVKSNPPQLISNLRYVQRFRAQPLMKGDAAYCLTNMMAVVAFLEHVDLMELGLSSDKVVTDEDVKQEAVVGAVEIEAAMIQGENKTFISQNAISAGLDVTRQIPRKVSQEIAAMSDTGIKLMSGVVDTMFGRFLPNGLNYQHPKTIEEVKNVVGAAALGLGKVPDISQKELKEVGAAGVSGTDPEKTPTAPISQTIGSRLSSINPLPRLSFDKSKSMSTSNNDFPHPNSRPVSLSSHIFAGFQAPFIQNSSNRSTSRSSSSSTPAGLENTNGAPAGSAASSIKSIARDTLAIEKFLNCLSANDLKIGDVEELLADYKRLASILQNVS